MVTVTRTSFMVTSRTLTRRERLWDPEVKSKVDPEVKTRSKVDPEVKSRSKVDPEVNSEQPHLVRTRAIHPEAVGAATIRSSAVVGSIMDRRTGTQNVVVPLLLPFVEANGEYSTRDVSRRDDLNLKPCAGFNFSARAAIRWQAVPREEKQACLAALPSSSSSSSSCRPLRAHVISQPSLFWSDLD
jgi:hypothetical protein